MLRARAKAKARPGRPPRRISKWPAATARPTRARKPRFRQPNPRRRRAQRPAITRVQRQTDKHALVVPQLGDRHRQAAGKGMAGAVIRMLAPGEVAEPADRAMQPRRVSVEAREERRGPALEALAVA